MISDDFKAILPQTVYLCPPTPRFNQENLSQKICMLGKRGTEFSMSEEVGRRWTNEYLSNITHRHLFPEYQCVSVKQCDDLLFP